MFFFFQAEDGIRDLVRSRGLGDVYKRQLQSLLGGKLNAIACRLAALGAVHPGSGLALVVRLSLIHI